jgi:hypothetical protein
VWYEVGVTEPGPKPPDPASSAGAPAPAAAPEPAAVAAVRGAIAARRAVVEAELKLLTVRSDGFSRIRGFLVLAGIVLGVVALIRGLSLPVAVPLGLVVLAFIVMVVRHAFLASTQQAHEKRLEIIDGGVARLDGAFDEDADPGTRFAPPASHPYAEDLDLFGPRSLFRLLCRARTGFGQATLAGWLLAPGRAETVKKRQDAARELSEKPLFLEELAVRALAADAKGQVDEPLVAWAEAAPTLSLPGRPAPDLGSRGLFVTAGKVLVPITLAAFVGSRFIVDAHPTIASLWVVPLVLQSVCLVALYGRLSRMVHTVSSRETPFGKFKRLFALCEETTFESAELEAYAKMLRRGGGVEGSPASAEIAALERIISFADLRHNTVVHFVANTGLLWDLWCALALERWRARCGVQVRGWLTALGAIEATASLATFAREHPTWVFPEIVDGPPRLVAERLGHPLIAASVRVVNDVSLVANEAKSAGFPGRAMLVTGSNMSGKSTYLRSIGTCAVMSLAGAPVCAAKATITPLATWTSMRIRDDLDGGVSHFYAELRRLKQVVDAATTSPAVLFLLDEILHGTNSRERIVGARAVVASLVAKGAVGAVSSHDLGLTDLPDVTDQRVENAHFRETVNADVMTFDYKLRPGVVDTSNALRLMRGVGLDVPLH